MVVPHHSMEGQWQQPVVPHCKQTHSYTSPYQMLFHWSRLDWNFPNPAMKQRFEERQDWKHCMPAGVKVDRQGRFYVSVPRWAEGVPATLNTIAMVDGKPILEAFPSWEWNTPGMFGCCNPSLATRLMNIIGCGFWIKEKSHTIPRP